MCHTELGIKKVSKNRLMIQAVMEIFESASKPGSVVDNHSSRP